MNDFLFLKFALNRLREEENQRKRVTKLLPAHIEKLKSEVEAYEGEHGVLLVNGNPCLIQIQENEEAYQKEKLLEKEKKKQERKHSQHSPSPLRTSSRSHARRFDSPARHRPTPTPNPTPLRFADLNSASKNVRQARTGSAMKQNSLSKKRNDENRNLSNFNRAN